MQSEAFGKDIADIEASRIAEVRSELAMRRLKYLKEVQSLVDGLAGVASEGQLGKLKDQVVDCAKEKVEDAKKAYRHAKLEIALKTFGVSLTPPALASTIASALGIGIIAPLGIAAALSVFTAQALIGREKARSARTKSPWSYVLESKKLLG